MEIKNVFIVGFEETLEVSCAIAQTVAGGGCDVTLRFTDTETCDEATERIRSDIDDVSIMDRIQTTIELSNARNADLVIESVFEDRELKQKMLTKLDDICSPETVIATNTSTITVTELASMTNRADQIIGMHFIYFSPVMKVVEIARGMHTSDATCTVIENFARELGMEVAISEDAPGLLSTRIWMVHLNEASNNVFNKLVEPSALAKLNRTISPNALSILESADFIGLDNCVALLQNLHQAYGDSKYAPSPLLTQMVSAGQLGMKTGKGFFNYS